MPKKKPLIQIPLDLGDKDADYFAALRWVRANQTNPDACKAHLTDELAARRIIQIDAITIWRGTFRKWITPFG